MFKRNKDNIKKTKNVKQQTAEAVHTHTQVVF